MTNVDAKDGQTFPSQGFRVAITPNELVVTSDRSAYDPRTKKWHVVVLISCAALSFAFFVGELFRQIREPSHISPGIPYGFSMALIWMVWVFSLTWPWAPLLMALQALYPAMDEFRCTKESIRITRMVRGKPKRIRDFSTSEVRRIQYVHQDFPWFGSPSCLGFRARDKRVSCLDGLKTSEAQRILDELGRMGLDVARNPDMPVMIEMEEPRRNG